MIITALTLVFFNLAVACDETFVRATPMNYIKVKGRKIITEKQQELFNQSYEVQITPLVIYGLGVDTNTHTHISA